MTSDELEEQINIELGFIDTIIIEIEQFNRDLTGKNPSIRELASISHFVVQFYNGIENILKRICKYNNYKLPFGGDSHILLLKAFNKDSINNLPILFDEVLFEEFSLIRKFRHIAIHGYAFQIKWAFIENSISRLPLTFSELKKEIMNFIEINKQNL